MSCLAPFTGLIYLSWPKGSKCFRAVLHSRLWSSCLSAVVTSRHSAFIFARTEHCSILRTWHIPTVTTLLYKRKRTAVESWPLPFSGCVPSQVPYAVYGLESNPSPGSKYNWEEGSNSAAWRQATGRSTPQPAQQYTQPDPSRRFTD